MLERLARFVIHHRKLVVISWLVLTLVGGFSASAINKRWLDQFSIPGYSAYEANQRVLKTFGSGAQPPHVALFTVKGDVTKDRAIGETLARFQQDFPSFRVGSYYTTGSRAYVSKDGHSTFATIYPPGKPGFNANSHTKRVRAAIRSTLPPNVEFHLTGRDALQDSQGESSGGPGVFTEALVGGAGALLILLVVFGTLPAVLMPIMVAIAAILNTFTLTWALTYVTDVSRIVQFLIALVGLGVAIDYALLMIFRFREELRHGH